MAESRAHLDPSHEKLADDADEHWVRFMMNAEDDGIDAGYAAAVLSTAAAVCEACELGAVEAEAGRIIPADRLRGVVDDFELVFLKTLADKFPTTLTDETRQRIASMDRRVKRSRGLPAEPGGEA